MNLEGQIALRLRPHGSPVMFQRWRSLLFLHFACEPASVQALLPAGLTVDTFPDADGNEAAWVGLVPFRMEGVRPRFTPSIPGLSAFPETNVRTYVHRDGREPGVWFFSLDAANALACRIARRFFSLPYFEASMKVIETADVRQYRSRRVAGVAGAEIEAVFGDLLPYAAPGTLEFFLIERYLLYAFRAGRLFTGRVHHSPYPLRSASLRTCRESLIQAAGLAPQPFIHVAASNGVDVQIFRLKS